MSLNTKLEEIMKQPAGMAIFVELMGSFLGGGANKAENAAAMAGPEMLQMLGSFTILRLLGMLPKQEGAPAVTKELLLSINEKLNQIPLA